MYPLQAVCGWRNAWDSVEHAHGVLGCHADALLPDSAQGKLASRIFVVETRSRATASECSLPLPSNAEKSVLPNDMPAA